MMELLLYPDIKYKHKKFELHSAALRQTGWLGFLVNITQITPPVFIHELTRCGMFGGKVS